MYYMNVLPIYNWFLYHFFPVNYLTTRSLVPRSSGTCAKNKRTRQKSRHCNNGGRSRPYWFWLLCTVYFEILSRFMCNILVFTEYSILLFGLQRHRGKEKKRERERELVHTLKCRFMSLDLSFYTFSYTRIHCIPATKKQSVQKYF